MGRVAVSREDGGAGGGRRVEERSGVGAGVEVIGGDDGAIVMTLALRAGAAGRVVRRMDGRRCTLLVSTATGRWWSCCWLMRGWMGTRRCRCVWEGRARAGGESEQGG